MDEILLRKAAAIERCIARVLEEYTGYENEIEDNYTKQDSIILNIQRAVQSTLDMALRYIKITGKPIPTISRDAYQLLHDANVISESMMIELKKTIGFRNIVVHEYKQISMDIVRSIITDRLPLLLEFKSILLKHG